MEVLDAAGDRAGAIRQARIHATLMAQELDAGPDPSVVALAERLRGTLATGATVDQASARQVSGNDLSSSAPSAVVAPESDGSIQMDQRPGDIPTSGGPRGSADERFPRHVTLALAAFLVISSGWLLRAGNPTEQRPANDVQAATPESKRLVVLPFTNSSDDPGEEYFSDGLTEELITALSQVHSLEIVARTSTFAYRKRDVRGFGRALDVGWVVEGSVRKDGERVRVWARLLDAETGVHLWSRTYERELADIFGIWADVAQRIATALEAELTPEDRSRLARQFRPAPEAHALYLKGRHFWRQRTAGAYDRAIECFERAIALEPRYAEAYAGLAFTYQLQSIYGHLAPQIAGERAQVASLRALELNDRLPEAHTALGGYLNIWAWDVDAAEAAWQRAIELDPGYSFVRHLYAILLKSVGRFEEALVQRRKAVELDPLDPHLSTLLARELIRAGRNEEALRHGRNALELDSLYWQAHMVLGEYYAAEGRVDDAIRAHRRAVEVASGSWSAAAGLAGALARGAEQEEARRILADLEKEASAAGIYHPGIAMVRAELNEMDAAMEWLELAYDQRHPGLALLAPDGPLADDARYADLLKRVGRLR